MKIFQRPSYYLILSLPAFHETETETASAADASVASNQSTTLSADTYRDINVAKNGTVCFAGGEYDVRSLSGGSGSSLVFQAPTELRLDGQLILGSGSFIGEDDGSYGCDDPLEGAITPTPAQIVFFIAGSGVDPTGAAAAFGAGRANNRVRLNANFYVPGGLMDVGRNTDLTGGVIAGDFLLNRDSTVDLDSAFVFEAGPAASATPDPQAPVGEPQTVFTNGAASIEITLTGSDPQGDDLIFFIETGPDPAKGALTTPVPGIPVPFGLCSLSAQQCSDFTTSSDCPSGEVCQLLGRCSISAQQCFDFTAPYDCPLLELDDVCEVLPLPPVNSATTTYTPISAAANFEDVFTFSVEDEEELAGLAVVDINPLDTSPPEPPVSAVDAEDVMVDTVTDQLTPIALAAGGPDGVTLTFRVESLPAGTLTDSNSVEVGSIRDLPGHDLTYLPPSGQAGVTDTFLFSARDSATGTGTCISPVCDIATVDIEINEQAELAEDQTIETLLNTPVQFVLSANPGGSGATSNNSSAPTTFRFATLDPGAGFRNATTSSGAAVAGAVIDTDGDGDGDEVGGGSEQLFGVGSVGDSLFTIDRNTGVTTQVGTLDPNAGTNGSCPNNFATPITMAVRPSDGTIFVKNNSRLDPCPDSSGTLTIELVTVDPDTGEATSFGDNTLGTSTSGGLAIDPTDPNEQLYQVSSVLETVDISGSVVTRTQIATIGVSCANADFDASGTLFCSTLGGKLYQINKVTGFPTFIGDLDEDPNTTGAQTSFGLVGSIAFAPDGTLLGSGQGADFLFDIDPLNAQVSNLRPLGSFAQGMGFRGGLSEVANAEVAGTTFEKRTQIEFNLGSLQFDPEKGESARVVLTTLRAVGDTDQTQFYVGTGVQDGELTPSDFDADASLLPGAVMPIPAGSQAGDVGTFTLAVTGELKQALDLSLASISTVVQMTPFGGGPRPGSLIGRDL